MYVCSDATWLIKLSDCVAMEMETKRRFLALLILHLLNFALKLASKQKLMTIHSSFIILFSSSYSLRLDLLTSPPPSRSEIMQQYFPGFFKRFLFFSIKFITMFTIINISRDVHSEQGIEH